MSDLYIIEKTEYTPEIILDKEEGVYTIKGRVITENAQEFFEPVINWFLKYFKKPNRETKLILDIDYINSSCSIEIMKIINIFENNLNKNNVLKIIWFYKSDDEKSKEQGAEFKLSTSVNFELIKVESTNNLEEFNFD